MPILIFLYFFMDGAAKPSPHAIELAEYALKTHGQDQIDLLAQLVAFKTFRPAEFEDKREVLNSSLPPFKAMTAFLKETAESFGLDFKDHGDVVVIGYGTSSERLGIVTHGDVVPADVSRWKNDPFTLDLISQPGKLVARGVEDDKGPIATALYAMKSLVEKGIKPRRRIELIISYTEESDWDPFRDFIAANPPPQLNVAIDSDYPVVVAEKGWIGWWIGAEPRGVEGSGPVLTQFLGGRYLGQVADEATALLNGVSPQDVARLKEKASQYQPPVRFVFEQDGARLQIRALGVAAHASAPSAGVNAIAYLADLLAGLPLAKNHFSALVSFINDRIGLGYLAEKFDGLAFQHEFMGPLTLVIGFVRPRDHGAVELGINFRPPIGKRLDVIEAELRNQFQQWNQAHGQYLTWNKYTDSAPYFQKDAPHVDCLLQIYAHFTGDPDPQPRSIGGGTHAKLLPYAVNFGPAMPNTEYTGHSEHEFMTLAQFSLNLKMYTAMVFSLSQ